MHCLKFEPDIIPNTRKRCITSTTNTTSSSIKRSNADFQVLVHLMPDGSGNSHTDRVYGHLHHLRNIDSSRYHENKTENNYNDVFKGNKNSPTRGPEAMPVSNHRSTTSCHVQKVSKMLPNNKIGNSLVLRDMNPSLRSRPNSCICFHNSPGKDCLNGLALMMHLVPSHDTRSTDPRMSDGRTERGNNFPAAQVTGQIQLMPAGCDPEVVKDIILTLRTLGDELDIKMRQDNEPFHHALLEVVQNSASQLLLATVKQFNLVGVAIDVSLSLLKIFNQ